MATQPTSDELRNRKICTRGNWKRMYKQASVDTLVALYHGKNRTDRNRAQKEIWRRQNKPEWAMGIVLALTIIGLLGAVGAIWLKIPIPGL
jgi:hypothetical protein